MYRSIYFLIKELVPPEVYAAEGDRAMVHVDERIVESLDQIRDFFGVPVTVNNWHVGGSFKYRCYRPEGCSIGAQRSMHKMDPCGAADCDVFGIDARKVRVTILANAQKFPHIRRMENSVNWVHIDIKPHDGTGIILFNP